MKHLPPGSSISGPDLHKKVLQPSNPGLSSALGGASRSNGSGSSMMPGGAFGGPPPTMPQTCPTQKTLMESALDVLPTDSDLDTFLQSPQLQMAWYMQLSVTQGEKEAILFKEVVVSMQQSPELLSDMKEQLEIKRQKMKSLGCSNKHNIAQKNLKQSTFDGHSSSFSSPASTASKANLSNVLMPSASSADTFYTLANAASRQAHGQPAAHGGQPNPRAAAPGGSDPVVNEVWKSHDTSSVSSSNLNEGGWGSMNSMDTPASISSPSVPLYKRRAGLGGEVHANHEGHNEIDDGFLSNLLEPQPWSELATRSSTLPSSSLSSIWSQGSRSSASGASNLMPSATSPINRTYANVLRQAETEVGGNLHDPLFKIRQIGTRGSQELFDSASTSPNTTFQQPFSPLNGKW